MYGVTSFALTGAAVMKGKGSRFHGDCGEYRCRSQECPQKASHYTLSFADARTFQASAIRLTLQYIKTILLFKYIIYN